MHRFVVLEKHLGQTPLQALEAWKAEHPEYADVPATYAGRLDPMAEGKLLVLLGDECKRQDRYRGLDKEYEIEVLLGVSTDTADVLGMPVAAERGVFLETLPSALAAETGTKTVPYPVYSSKTVNGTPLFLHALQGTLQDIEIPTHEETVYRIKLLGQKTLSTQELETRVMDMLSHAPRTDMESKKLGADFRQDAIREAWKTLLAESTQQTFEILSLRVSCGSGAYMRSLAERIGKRQGTSACALSIKRTRIGRYLRIPGIWVRSLA